MAIKNGDLIDIGVLTCRYKKSKNSCKGCCFYAENQLCDHKDIEGCCNYDDNGNPIEFFILEVVSSRDENN